MVFCFILFFFCLEKINGTFIISLEIINVDDCIYSIKLDNTNVLYQKETYDSHCDTHEYYLQGIHYEIGQKLNIEVIDKGGSCFLKANVRVSDYNFAIYTNDKKFWKCENCDNSINQEGKTKFLCYADNAYPIDDNNKQTFHYYFQINSISDLPNINYYYYLNQNHYFYISTSNLNEKIDLIDLHLMDNLYAINNNEERLSPFYDYICYKLFFYQYFSYQGIFYGSDGSNNDIILNEESCSRIISNKPLRYKLSNEEIENKGTHVKIRIGIFNNNDRKSVSPLQEFNFFICMNGYKSCDLETSMKCLKEGYYQMNNKYYSCY